MEVFKLHILVYIFVFSFSTYFTPKCETKETSPYHYTLSTKLLKSVHLQDPIAKKFFNSFEEHNNYINSVSMPTKVPKLVKNLYSTLKHFIKQNCLIVVNNFEGADMYSKDWIWIPKELAPKLNGNFSRQTPKDMFFHGSYKECQPFNFIYSIWLVDTNSFHSLDSQSFNFILNSRPWQCEVQVELFMPDVLLRIGKHTCVFQSLTIKRLKSVPSLRPAVHILIFIFSEMDIKKILEIFTVYK